MFVHYSKTKAEFIAAGLPTTYNNNIVFIKGDANGNGSCIYTHGTYFANFNEFLAAVNYVKGVKVGDSQYNATAGGGYIPFAAADNSTVALNVENGTITVGLTEAFVNKVNDTASNLGSKNDAANSTGSAFARIANLAQLVSDLTGGSVDSIEGQITKAVDALRTEITGDLTDTTDAKTIEAINDELNAIDAQYAALEPRVKAIEDDYLKGADKTELANRITNEAPVTVSEAAGSGDILKTYTFTQNGKAIGTINLAKELVVTGGVIVVIDGVKNLQLTIANQEAPVNIPVNELVDAYTGGGPIDISESNVISVDYDVMSSDLEDLGFYKMVNGAINEEDLDAHARRKLSLAETAYQKPADGINTDDLAENVRTAISRANNAVRGVNAQKYIDVETTEDHYVNLVPMVSKDLSAVSEEDKLADANAVKSYVDSMWEWEEL